jgi:molecular chaperone HscB
MWLRRKLQRVAALIKFQADSTPNAIQKPIVLSLEHNFFQIFDLPEAFELDEKELGARYHKLQSETHPDRFAGEEEEKKLQAVQLNSYLNEAYATLKSPLRRAGYLLQRKNIDPESVSQEDLDMDLLMEQMQLRENLAELPQNESALPKLDAMKAEAKSRIEERESRFAEAFSADQLPQAKKIFHELQFIYKLLDETLQAEEQRLGY